MERGPWVGSRVKGSARRGETENSEDTDEKSSRYSTFLIIFSSDLASFFVLVHRVGENIFIN